MVIFKAQTSFSFSCSALVLLLHMNISIGCSQNEGWYSVRYTTQLKGKPQPAGGRAATAPSESSILSLHGRVEQEQRALADLAV